MKYLFYIYLCLFLIACIQPRPEPIVLPKTTAAYTPRQISDNGKITRDLYRSFWVLPSKDQDPIHLGIIPEAMQVSFSSHKDYRIRIHEESGYWDIYSPAGVKWIVKESSLQRPRLVRYFATIDYQIRAPHQYVQNNELLPWIKKGFKQAQWIGPPKMDLQLRNDQLSRYFLSLADFTDEQKANLFCQKFQRSFDQKCTVVGRVELPQLGQGTIKAIDGNFEKTFTGIIEVLIPEDQSVQVYDVPVKLLSDEKKTLSIDQKLYILPHAETGFSVVEALSLQDYLAGVLPSEIFPNAPMDALQAQAVIARTYTLSQLWSRYSLEPFYTCVTTQCQAYHADKKDFPKVRHAISKTKNMVLRNKNGDFTQTFYHASSGGKTDNAKTIFHVDTSYHGGINETTQQHPINLTIEKDVRNLIQNTIPTYCSTNQFSKSREVWKRSFSPHHLEKIFGKPVIDIQVLTRSISGRIVSINIIHPQGQTRIDDQLRIRRRFENLPSTLMIIDFKRHKNNLISITMTGRGHGHGVGLSQLGAIGRAEHGQNYQQILQTYYPSTVLSTIALQ